MKKLWGFILILIIPALLWGCSGKKDLVGVYMTKNGSSPSATIILYADGSCSYRGDGNTTWDVTESTVTVTKQEPDTYYIDVFPDPSLSSAEMRSIAPKCNRIETVKSATFIPEEGKLRVEISSQKTSEQTREALLGINGVVSAEFVVIPGPVHNYKLDVVDHCLVTSGGEVYIRQGKG